MPGKRTLGRCHNVGMPAWNGSYPQLFACKKEGRGVSWSYAAGETEESSATLRVETQRENLDFLTASFKQPTN